MSKTRAIVLSSLMILLSVALMGGFLIINKNITYSLPDTNNYYAKDITINNIEVLDAVDPERVDGPNLVGTNINLDIDLYPNETYIFRYDITNLTDFDYELKNLVISCDNNPEVMDYISIDAVFENGELLLDNTLIPGKTKRTVYVTIKYDKNFNDIQPFKLYFDMDFDLR